MSTVSIRKGNSLSQMVRDFNRTHGTKFTVDQIAKANGIKDPNKIQAGGKLLFPDKFETNAPTSVMRNAEGGKTVRNGVKEDTTVKMSDSPTDLITTNDAQISTTITPRQLLPLPNRNADTFEQSNNNNPRTMILQ